MTENGDQRIIRGEKFNKDKVVNSKPLLTVSYQHTVRTIIANEGLGHYQVIDGKSSFIHSESYQNRGRNGGVKMSDLTVPYFRSLFDRSKSQLPKDQIEGAGDEEVASAFLIMLLRNEYYDLVYRYLSLTRHYEMRLDYRVFSEFLRLAPERADRIVYVFSRLASPPNEYSYSDSRSQKRDTSAKTICAHVDNIVSVIDILIESDRYDLIGEALSFKNDLFERFAKYVAEGKASGKTKNLKDILFNRVIVRAFKEHKELILLSSYNFNSLLATGTLGTLTEVMTLAKSMRTVPEQAHIVATFIRRGGFGHSKYRIPKKLFELALTELKDSLDDLDLYVDRVVGGAKVTAQMLSHINCDKYIIEKHYYFKNVDLTPYMLKLLNQGDAEQEYVATKLLQAMYKKPGLITILTRIIEGNNAEASRIILDLLSVNTSGSEKLSCPDSLARTIQRKFGTRTLLRILRHFSLDVINTIIKDLTEEKDWEVLAKNLDSFENINRETAQRLCLAGFSYEVLKSLKHFSPLEPIDYVNIVTLSQKHQDWRRYLVYGLNGIPTDTLPVQLFVELLTEQNYSFDEGALIEHLDVFNSGIKTNGAAQTQVMRLLDSLFSEREIEWARELMDFFHIKSNVIDQAMRKFFNDNIDEFDFDIYQMVSALINNDNDWWSRELHNVGIMGTGSQAVSQLKSFYLNVQSRLLAGTLTDDALQSEVVFAFVRYIVRYERSSEGDGSQSAFESEMEYYKKIRDGLKYRGERSRIASTYAPSSVVYVERNDSSKKERNYSIDFHIRWGIVREAIANGLAAWDQTRRDKSTDSLKAMIESVRHQAKGIRKMLLIHENQYLEDDSETKEKALTNIRLRLEALDVIESLTHEADINDIRIAVNAISYFGDEFTLQIISLAVYFACAMHPHIATSAPDLAMTNPSLEQVSWVIDLLDHHIGGQSVGSIFTDNTTRSNFRRIIRTGALKEGLDQAKNTSSKTSSIQFIPDQGLLMLFSGQLADACWASGEIDKHPNIFSVAMVQNPGTKHESIIGASLMIEATARDGTKLLIIRGLNPRESAINSLDVEDFCHQYFEYAQGLAQASGRKLAITIDDHSGGAGTNRPVLFRYLYERLRPRLQPVSLASQAETEFNGYDIRGDTYYL